MNIDPATYDAWYHTPRGAWIGEREFALLMRLAPLSPGMSLLDVGSGSGYFSRRFADAGLAVTGVEPDRSMLAYAKAQEGNKQGNIAYIGGSAQALPLPPASFDVVSAITSLCFVRAPELALAECWRVARRGVLLGLLNRHSLLYRQKQGRGSYQGARWDTRDDVLAWQATLSPQAAAVTCKTGVFFPHGGTFARLIERVLPTTLPWGGFLAVYLEKPSPLSL